MINFPTLRKEVHTWSLYNFGDQPLENPLIGIIEETGELAHALLKHRQNIRQSPSQSSYKEALKDAIGDIVIYLCDYTARLKLTDSLFHPRKLYPTHQGSIQKIAAQVGFICLNHTLYVNSMSPIEAQDLLTELAALCNTENIDFEDAIATTWAIVQQRDWVKFPKNGRTE